MGQVSSRKVAKHPAQLPVAASAATNQHRSLGSGQAILPIGAHYHQSPAEVIEIVRQGVPAERLVEIGACLNRSKEWLFRTLKLPRSTMDHKIRQHERLSPEYSEQVKSGGGHAAADRI